MISTSPEPLRRLVADIMQEHARAVAKFPGPNVNMTALVEEAGELAEALAGYLVGLTAAQGRLARVLLHFRPDDGGDSTWAEVRKEAVQVAVMALRVALEGDSTLAQPDGADALQVAPQDNVAPLPYPEGTEPIHQLLDVTGDVLSFLDVLRHGGGGIWVQEQAATLQTALEVARVLVKRDWNDRLATGQRFRELANLAHDWRPAARGGKVCARCTEYRPADLQPGDVISYCTQTTGDGPAKRVPIYYQPDEVCHGPRSEANDTVDEADPTRGTFGDQVPNRSHVAMDRFPRQGDVLMLRVVHWRQGVERMSGGDLFHLERFDHDTGKWRETNPPLDMQAGSSADLLAKVTTWRRDHGVTINWQPKVFAAETDRLLAPITPTAGYDKNTMHENVMDILERAQGFMNATLHGGTLNHDEIMRAIERIIQVRKDLMDAAKMDTASAGAAIRVDGELFTDVQIRAMVDQVRDFMRDPPAVNVAGAALADDPVIFANTVPPLPDGAAIVAIHTNKRMLTATLEPHATHYRVEGKDLVADWTLVELLRNAGLLDPVNEERITTPRGLCRIEGDKATSWRVEQFDGKHWVQIAGDVSLQIAQGVYNRRMKEQFPADEVLKKTREQIVKHVTEEFRTSINQVRDVLNTVRETIMENGQSETPAWEKAYQKIDELLNTPPIF